MCTIVGDVCVMNTAKPRQLHQGIWDQRAFDLNGLNKVTKLSNARQREFNLCASLNPELVVLEYSVKQAFAASLAQRIQELLTQGLAAKAWFDRKFKNH